MGNQASSEAQKALECCTAVDVDDEAEATNGEVRGGPRRKVVRDVCHEALGESLFTECLDERGGNRDRPGRSRNGSVAGSRASRASGEGGQHPGWNTTLSQSLNIDRPPNGTGFPGPRMTSELEEKMRKLVHLHQRGHITDGEFFVAKARLLQGKDLSLNSVASPSVVERQEQWPNSLSAARGGVQYSVDRVTGDASVSWAGSNRETFAEDLAPDDSFSIRTPVAIASRSRVAPNGHNSTGGEFPVAGFVPLRYVPQVGDYHVTDVPTEQPPSSVPGVPLPPPIAQHHPGRSSPPAGMQDFVIQNQVAANRAAYPTRLGTVAPSSPSVSSPGEQGAKSGSAALASPDKARQEWLAERELAIKEMDTILAGAKPSADGAATAVSALAEANRQVQEQKRLLQEEQMKLLKVLNGSGGAARSNRGSPQIAPSRGGREGSVHRRESSGQGRDSSVEERMLHFLKDDSAKLDSPRTPRVITPREKGRVVNLLNSPSQIRSKDTQFVI